MYVPVKFQYRSWSKAQRFIPQEKHFLMYKFAPIAAQKVPSFWALMKLKELLHNRYITGSFVIGAVLGVIAFGCGNGADYFRINGGDNSKMLENIFGAITVFSALTGALLVLSGIVTSFSWFSYAIENALRMHTFFKICSTSTTYKEFYSKYSPKYPAEPPDVNGLRSRTA